MRASAARPTTRRRRRCAHWCHSCASAACATYGTPAPGAGNLLRTLRKEGFRLTGTGGDFLSKTTAPAGVDTIATNPPFGFGGRLAVRFVEHAITLTPIVAMLLRIDFDSARNARTYSATIRTLRRRSCSCTA
jgi:hypothetical protein